MERQKNRHFSGPPEGVIAGAGEKLQYLAHEMNDNTVRFALHYPCRLSSEILSQAVREVIGRVDVLHSSFHPGNLGAFWRINKNLEESDYFHLVEVESNPMIEAQKAMLLPVALDGKVQMHCTLIQSREESAIVLNISHLCVDGGDGRYLLEKVMQAYRLIKEEGSAEQLEVKNGSRSAFQVYKELSRKEYLSAAKPNLPGVKTEFPFPEKEDGKPHLVVHRLASELVQNTRKKGKEVGATVNDLLLTACYRALVKLPGVDKSAALSIMSMMDMRRHCQNGESDGLCNMSGSLPTVLEQGVTGDFAETLAEISAQTRKVKEDPLAGLYGMPVLHTAAKTMPLWLLLKVAQRVYGHMAVGLTNMGHIPYDELYLDGTSPMEGLFAGPLKKKPGMQISAAGFGGDITLCCIGEYGEEDAKLIRVLLEHVEEELRIYAGDGI